MTLNITTFNIMTLGITKFTAMTLGIKKLITMARGITTLSIKTFTTAISSIQDLFKTLSIKVIFVTLITNCLSIIDTQHNNTIMLSVIMLSDMFYLILWRMSLF